MAILSELIEMNDLKTQLESKYGPTIQDKETLRHLTWIEAFNQVYYGVGWEISPKYLQDQQSIGGYKKEMFETLRGFLKELPEWAVQSQK